MNQIHFDETLDVRGLNCPLPVVKARKKIGELENGQILKVLSTDRGSVKDFQGWAKVAKNIELLAQDTETQDEAELYIHFVQKAD
jgi:tRNA 2-thiouridine synthesizing protein A